MNKEQSIQRLIELAGSLKESEQEKLACVAQGMIIAVDKADTDRTA